MSNLLELANLDLRSGFRQHKCLVQDLGIPQHISRHLVRVRAIQVIR
jgi:hypothetical protein